MQALVYAIRSLTLISTGDSARANERLLGTGLRGSLRAQYWLLNAMALWLADRQQANHLPYKGEDKAFSDRKTFTLRQALSKAGPVIQLFGTTGWRPVFDIELVWCRPISDPVPCNARYGQQVANQWEFFLRFHRNRATDVLEKDGMPLMKDPATEIERLMQFVHYWGWLGSAPQNGLGWVTVAPRPMPPVTPLLNNPFFAAADVGVTETQINALLQALSGYYAKKYMAKKKEIHAAPSLLKGIDQHDNSNHKRVRYLKNLIKHGPKTLKRYQMSISTLAPGVLPVTPRAVFHIGYEIKRYLRFLLDPSGRNRQTPFGDLDNAGQLHISHPVLLDDGWTIRLRFCGRPGIYAQDEQEPRRWLAWIQTVLCGDAEAPPDWPRRRFMEEKTCQ